MKMMKQFPLVLFMVFLFGSAAAAQEKPGGASAPGPTVVYQSKFPIVLDGREYDLLTVVFDFPTGAGIPKHYHGGHATGTVLSGEITMLKDGTEKVYKTGETFTENPGEEHAVVNRGASARLVGTMVLPKGAADTTFVK